MQPKLDNEYILKFIIYLNKRQSSVFLVFTCSELGFLNVETTKSQPRFSWLQRFCSIIFASPIAIR